MEIVNADKNFIHLKIEEKEEYKIKVILKKKLYKIFYKII